MSKSFVAVTHSITIFVDHLAHFSKMPKWLNKLQQEITEKEITKEIKTN